MPSQKQLKWSQLKVGLTVVFASVTLILLIFLMSGSAVCSPARLPLNPTLITPVACAKARPYA